VEGRRPPFAALFFFGRWRSQCGGATRSLAFFLLRLFRQKKKAADKSSLTNSLFVYINSIAVFSLQNGGAKKKLSKRNAEVFFRRLRTATRLRALRAKTF